MIELAIEKPYIVAEEIAQNHKNILLKYFYTLKSGKPHCTVWLIYENGSHNSIDL